MSSASCSPDQLDRLLKRALSGTAVHLNDVFLSDRGCERLCELLENDTHVSVLDLRGNNIHCGGLTALAHLIRHNKFINRLSLQWNPIGSDSSSFMSFMDAIGVNRSLVSLDLRNCKLTPNAGTHIGSMVCRNTTLKQLDLRWNSLGADGSRSILSGLDNNHTLTDIQLSGNDVPTDVIASIADRAQRNRHRQRSPSPVKSLPPSSALDDSLRFAQGRLDALQTENAHLKSELTDLQMQLATRVQSESELSRLRGQYEVAERDWQSKNSMKQIELDNVQQMLNESVHKNETLQTELQQCQKQLETLSFEGKRREETDLQIREALRSEIAALTEQIDKDRLLATERLGQIQNKLHNEINHYISEKTVAEKLQRDERIRYESELEGLKMEIERRSKQANDTIQKLTSDCNQKSRDLIDLQEKHAQQMFQADDDFKRYKQQLVDQHQREIDSKTSVFETRIIQLEACREELQKRLSGAQTECDRMRDQLEQNRIKHEHMIQLERIERSNTDYQLKAAQADCKRKDSEIASLNTEIGRLKEEIRSVASRAEADIEAKIGSKTRKIEELIERLGAKDDQIERMSRELQHLEGLNRQLNFDRDRRDRSFRSAILGLRQVFESELDAEDEPVSASIRQKPRKSRTENRAKKLGLDYNKRDSEPVVNKS